MPMKHYSTFSQSTNEIAHGELLWVQIIIEQLHCPFFVMYGNLSRKVGPQGNDGLTVSFLFVQSSMIKPMISHSLLILSVTEMYYKPGCTEKYSFFT